MANALRNEIKTFVEWQLKCYQENKRVLKESKTFSNPRYRTQLRHSVEAIDTVLSSASEEELALISMVYWKRTHTITGAGMELNLGRSTAYRYQERIIKAIAKELGYAM